MYSVTLINADFLLWITVSCCWLDERNGVWPVKTSASKSFGMAVNVNKQGTSQSTLWVQRLFSLSCEAVKMLRIRLMGEWESRGQPANPGWPVHWSVYVELWMYMLWCCVQQPIQCDFQLFIVCVACNNAAWCCSGTLLMGSCSRACPFSNSNRCLPLYALHLIMRSTNGLYRTSNPNPSPLAQWSVTRYSPIVVH